MTNIIYKLIQNIVNTYNLVKCIFYLLSFYYNQLCLILDYILNNLTLHCLTYLKNIFDYKLQVTIQLKTIMESIECTPYFVNVKYSLYKY